MTATEQLRVALAVEWMKFRRARPVWTATALLTIGMIALSVLTLGAVDGANPAIAGKAQSMVDGGGQAGLFAAAATIVSAGGLLGFGVVAGWVFGREFTDGTITGLWATSVARSAVATAKLLLLLAWSLATTAVLAAALTIVSLLLDTAAADTSTAALAGKFMVIAVLTAGLATPCAWVATVGRGYLPAIGTVIAIVLVAQMAVMAGAGGWFPFAAPGLWAAGPQAGTVTGAQLAFTLVVPVAFSALTVQSWRRLTLAN
ncbi:ABC transporter permease [Rhodococcus sp. NPDC060090]|uniref:ABC transporter permease n=1 Tax=Rhodococcus sp. NPDC060090 TaxID=3347056 RepID=UPI0036542F2F